ncbi:MAG: MarR family transcriptional regulator [Oscillospiraceae bacterium]|nr:MarR family transcriptional regulator [Oscillospiraceae bacterium]
MDKNRYDALKLENQLCFPIYACAREVIKQYTAYLEKIGLTYTQYITMMILWEKGSLTAKELGNRLYLDSGTLTPMLKKMEAKGLVDRKRSEKDERCLTVSVTQRGMALREKALEIPRRVARCNKLSREESEQLYTLLYKILGEASQANGG